MFCDLEGFTALSEKLGPEESFGLMDPIYAIQIHGTQDYGGTVNEMTGDGIMALFGAPVALEDAPQRAIRAALAIHREMARFNDKMKRERPGLPTLKMRIGIHTGPVVVGTLGNDLRVEFKAVGDTVNLASRMEGLAEPGTTYVTDETFRLTEGLFRFEGLGEKEVKGKEEPVAVYRVIAPSTRRTRFDVSAERGLTPFVGRERELELLLDALERAKEGRGQAVSIRAGPGEGKSRLLYQFRTTTANEDVTFLEGKCLSYSRGVAYHPVIDILKGNFDVREADGDEAVREKVQRGLRVLGADDGATTPYLLELLSVKDSGYDQISMSPEGKKDKTLQALNRIVLRGAETRPLILAVEDLHWIDKSSEDAFKDILEHIAGARVLLLFTYRTEYVHTWGGRSYHSEITLNRLANREARAMATHVLGAEHVAENLVDLILEKTEGVPFFVEEFVKSLRDLGIIKRRGQTYVLTRDLQDAAIPSTIRDVIMARVDSLPEGAKDLLQTASVIEREFPYPLIQRVTGLTEREILSHLSNLKDAELLYERGVYPQSTYVFKHALTREALYESVLSKKREQLHEAIARTMESLFEGRIDEHCEVICEHFIASGNFEKGADYARLATRKAKERGAFADAVAYSEKRISCLGKLPTTRETQKSVIDARTTHALYILLTTDFASAKETIEPIFDLVLESQDKKRIAQLNTIMGVYHLKVEDEVLKGLSFLQEAVEITDELDDMNSRYFANYWLGIASAYDCKLQESVHHLKRAINTIRSTTNNPLGISVATSCISWAYNINGEIELGNQASREALRLAEESGDTHSKGVAYTSDGMSRYGKLALTEATNHLQMALDFCEKADNHEWTVIALDYLSKIYFVLGEYGKCMDFCNRRIVVLTETTRHPCFIGFSKILMANAMVKNNERDINLDELYRYATENKVRYLAGSMARHIGDILFDIDSRHLSNAEGWIKKAIDADLQNDTKWELANDYALYADWFERKEDLSRARQNLGKAIEIFQECGADGWVKRTEEKLAQL
jgi:class 3 adenylate cyclase/tetratricopeptide (TPR) repeat protein